MNSVFTMGDIHVTHDISPCDEDANRSPIDWIGKAIDFGGDLRNHGLIMKFFLGVFQGGCCIRQ